LPLHAAGIDEACLAGFSFPATPEIHKPKVNAAMVMLFMWRVFNLAAA
jgi:hypothetical protein